VEPRRRTPEARGLGPWLARSAPASARGEVTIAIVGDATVRALNRRFRQKDRVTDVLAFPAAASQLPLKSAGKQLKTHELGEIVIARGVAARQARRLGHPLATELKVLALHGLLHLLGYDHEVDQGQMARAEARLRRRLRLPEGLIARSS
jgi:probable rRNA maturation factor